MLRSVAFLNSWSDDCARGSGTAVAIAQLHFGLTELGVEVQTVLPELGSTESFSRRVFYNLRLLNSADLSKFDSVVGFDMDGVFAPTSSVPYFVSLKGVARDEARFERGCARIKLLLLALLEKRNAAKAEKVIVTSNYSKKKVMRLYAVPSARMVVIPESIDLDARRRLAEGVVSEDRGNTVTILSVARQYRRKDTETLLRSFSQLLDRRSHVSLRIVGGGPELPRLRRLANRLDLGQKVTFLGSVRSKRLMIKEYLEADIFCLSSLQEGFGIVFLEAMAAGLPIVAARAGAVPEVVDEGEVGLLFEPGNTRELSERLEYLVGAPKLREEMGEEGKARVRRFDLSHIAAQFVRSISPLQNSRVDLEDRKPRRTLVKSKVPS